MLTESFEQPGDPKNPVARITTNGEGNWRRRDSHPRPKIHPRRNLRCVSASEVSLPASRSGEESPEANPSKSHCWTTEIPASNQPAEMTSSPGPQADRGGRSQVLRLRERAACPQLWLCPSD